MIEGSLSLQTAPIGPDCRTHCGEQDWLRRVERLRAPLLKSLTVRIGPDDAQDVLQDFYLRVLRYRPVSDNDAGARLFINRILRSVVADHFRSRAVQKKVAAAIATGWETPVCNDPVDPPVSTWLPALIGQLPRQYATLIDRIDINDEPRSAVAVTLGITSNNLAVRLTRARSALRIRLLAFDDCCPAHGFTGCCCKKSSSRPTALTRSRNGPERRLSSR